MRLLMLWVLFLVVGCSEGDREQARKPAPTPQFNQSAKVTVLGQGIMVDSMAVVVWTSEERALYDSYREGAVLIAKQSTLADSLVRFFDQNASKVKRLDHERYQVIESSTSLCWFFVGPTIEYTTDVEATNMAKGAMFIPSERLMALYYNGFTSLVRGLFLLHELSHAYDCVVLGEPDSPPLSPTWLMGELNAHSTVGRVLDQYSKGQWNQIVQACAAEHDQVRAQQGFELTAAVTGLSTELSQRIRRLVPVNDQDILYLHTQLVVEANLTNMSGLAENAEEFQRLALAYLRFFYGQADPSLFQRSF